MPDLESHWLAEKLAYLGRSLSRDTVWGHKVRDAFPQLESSPKAGHRQPRAEALFACAYRKALAYLPRKELYR